MLRRILAAALLVLLPATALAVVPTDFPLPHLHSAIAQSAENLDATQTPFCDPTKTELLARFDEEGYHWTVAITVADDGSARFIFMKYVLDGDRSAPLAVFIGHTPSEHPDSVVIDKAIEGSEIKSLYPDGPCSILYPKGA